MNPRDTRHCDKFLLWIDAVGGFWVCLADEVVLGRPEQPRGGPDVPILADLSARHARIRRDREGYVIEALREVRIGGRPVRPATWLADGNRIELGEGVQIALSPATSAERHGAAGFSQPPPHSAQHRRRAADGRLLRVGTELDEPRALPRLAAGDHPLPAGEHGDELYCRSSRPFRDRRRAAQGPRAAGMEFAHHGRGLFVELGGDRVKRGVASRRVYPGGAV